MNNEELTSLIKESFEDKSKYNFIKRINIIDTMEGTLPETGTQLIAADTLDGGCDTADSFEFVTCNYPHIKCGIRLKGGGDERLKFASESLATAAQQRINILLALYMIGGGSIHSFSLRIKSPYEAHSHVDSTKNGIKNIQEKLTRIEELYGAKYDRITLSSTLLMALTNEVKIPAARKKLKSETGLKIDVDDTYYLERNKLGDTIKKPYIQLNTAVFSHSKNDNSDKFYFANLPITQEDDDVNDKYGIVGYIKDNMVWSLMRGIPVLTDETLFSSITFKD